jgi:hypothetical protein
MGARRIEEARRWFQQAVYDLKAAWWNLEGEFFNTVCFLAQPYPNGLPSGYPHQFYGRRVAKRLLQLRRKFSRPLKPTSRLKVNPGFTSPMIWNEELWLEKDPSGGLRES